jgi:hypothetical protein
MWYIWAHWKSMLPNIESNGRRLSFNYELSRGLCQWWGYNIQAIQLDIWIWLSHLWKLQFFEEENMYPPIMHETSLEKSKEIF